MYALNACRESVSHLYAAYSCVTGNVTESDLLITVRDSDDDDS